MPLLPLELWRSYFHQNPFHFWGLSSVKVPVTSTCNRIVRKYAWQGTDAAGRVEIEQAIQTACDRLWEYLGYAPAPRYTQKTIPWPRFRDSNLTRYGGGAPGVSLGDGYVHAFGVEQITSLGDAIVTISDADGDGINDKFILTIATTETDPNKLALYFISTDRLESAPLSEDWRIQPVTITIAAGTATITGHSWLIVKPIKYEGFYSAPENLDPNVLTNFASSLHVAVRTTNSDGETVTDAQATLLWENDGCGGWWGCCGDVYAGLEGDPAAMGMAVGRVGLRDGKNGIILPVESIRNATTGIWQGVAWSTFREPDRVTVRYLSGYRTPGYTGTLMEPRWQVIVARLAAAELARRINACDEGNQELYHWQFDISRAAGANDEQYSISPADLDNPLGTRRGQVWAWKQIRNLRLGQGILV